MSVKVINVGPLDLIARILASVTKFGQQLENQKQTLFKADEFDPE
jgi:hypothetical protein